MNLWVWPVCHLAVSPEHELLGNFELVVWHFHDLASDGHLRTPWVLPVWAELEWQFIHVEWLF